MVGIQRQIARYRLNQLQDARFHTETDRRHRHQHPQHEILVAQAFDFTITASDPRLSRWSSVGCIGIEALSSLVAVACNWPLVE